jgi:hypothetical protein
MKQTLIENNYVLLPSEEIPDCCASCYNLGYDYKYNKWILFCLLTQDTNSRVCYFAKCDKYIRKRNMK